jgi:hypothetical protein
MHGWHRSSGIFLGSLYIKSITSEHSCQGVPGGGEGGGWPTYLKEKPIKRLELRRPVGQPVLAHTARSPVLCWRFTLSGPPIPRAFSARRFNSSNSFSNGTLFSSLQPTKRPLSLTIRHRYSSILWQFSRRPHYSPTDCTPFGDTCIFYRAPGYSRKISSPYRRIP